MATLYSIPALPESVNRYTRNRGDNDRDGAGAPQQNITRRITFRASPRLIINLEQMDGFSTEAYTYRRATNVQTPTNNVAVTQYQLVAYGDGPGWGADLTKLTDQGAGVTNLAAVNKFVNAVYDDADSSDTIGRTEGKYVLFAGFDADAATEFQRIIAQQLEQIRVDENPVVYT